MPPDKNNNSQLPKALRYRSLDRRQFNAPAGGSPTPPPTGPGPKRSKLRFLDHRQKWQSLSKKHKIVVILVAILVVVFGVLLAHNLMGQSSNPAIDINKQQKAATVASPLTGVQVSPELAKRTVTGIMIENSLDARPQSGIQDAGVIFEAIAEGGITRFLTLYQEARPAYIGPVRSLRPYYIDWASAFDAPIAHVGGSPDALAQIRSGGKDLDQFFNAGSYWREVSRPSPHDVYTNFDKLDALNKAKGYTSSTFTSWPRKIDQKLATPSAKTIDLAISGPSFNVHYDYDAASNGYHRSEGGAPHIATSSAGDKTGTLLAPKVVVVLIMPYSIVDDSGHSGYGVNGTGTVYVFQDGGATAGTWSKGDRASQLVFKDTSGQPIKLDAGQTWVTALQDGQLHYSP